MRSYTISGKIITVEGDPLSGVIAETGLQGVEYNGACTHFDITNNMGVYAIKGVIRGERFINVTQCQYPHIELNTQNVTLFKDEIIDIAVD